MSQLVLSPHGEVFWAHRCPISHGRQRVRSSADVFMKGDMPDCLTARLRIPVKTMELPLRRAW